MPLNRHLNGLDRYRWSNVAPGVHGRVALGGFYLASSMGFTSIGGAALR